MNDEIMLFPGFATIFKDTNNFIHLYFFPGIDNFNQQYYNTLDLSDCKVKYQEIQHEDKSSEFIFASKNIIKINCKLITKYNDVKVKTLLVN